MSLSWLQMPHSKTGGTWVFNNHDIQKYICNACGITRLGYAVVESWAMLNCRKCSVDPPAQYTINPDGTVTIGDL